MKEVGMKILYTPRAENNPYDKQKIVRTVTLRVNMLTIT